MQPKSVQYTDLYAILAGNVYDKISRCAKASRHENVGEVEVKLQAFFTSTPDGSGFQIRGCVKPGNHLNAKARRRRPFTRIYAGNQILLLQSSGS